MRWLPIFCLVLLLCLAAWGLLWWIVLGAGRAARRRELQSRIRRCERSQPPPSPATLRALHDAAQEARHALCSTGGREALYRRPWVLFVGDPAADLHALLASAHPVGPVASPAAGEVELFWRWWLTGRLTAIEVCPPPLAPALPQDALWLRALLELARQRPRRPLDGIALCVSTATLQADPSVARPALELLCRRAHETLQGLRVHMPVYVVVTGLQRLPGYATVHAALPPEALARTLGGLVTPGEPPTMQPAIGPVFEPLMRRLQALRLGLLPQFDAASPRADVHRFVEAMQALAPGLALLVEQMARAGDAQAALPWRALSFTASGPQGAFVNELFERWLPDDQGLARARD